MKRTGREKSVDPRTLQQVLDDVATVLFPADHPPPSVSLDSVDCDGDTPLHVYLWRDDPWAVCLLLRHGANPNAIGDMGETPLHVAVRRASAETIARLLAAGARDDIVSEFGQTAEELARDVGRASAYKEARLIARDLVCWPS